jgi:hypothetical protein
MNKIREYILNELKSSKFLFWCSFTCVIMTCLSGFLELIDIILLTILHFLT